MRWSSRVKLGWLPLKTRKPKKLPFPLDFKIIAKSPKLGDFESLGVLQSGGWEANLCHFQQRPSC